MVGGRIYDVTSWLMAHPGGDQILLEVAGKDATKDFESAAHTPFAEEKMAKFHIGILEGKKPEDLRKLVTYASAKEEAERAAPKQEPMWVAILPFLIVFILSIYVRF